MISVTLGPVLNSKEALMGAVAVFRDITREVESDRLKTEFIGTVSHELRTPMTSIKGFTQLLSMGSLGPINDTQKEFLQIIQTNAERMISIINDLLDITKIETGSVELDLRPLHMAEALSNVVIELQPNIQAREHTLTISIPPGLPLVRADAKRLNQILANLLSNAVKYTPRGGSIALEAREVDMEAVPGHLREGLKPKSRYALIEIRDTGVGIARGRVRSHLRSILPNREPAQSRGRRHRPGSFAGAPADRAVWWAGLGDKHAQRGQHVFVCDPRRIA